MRGQASPFQVSIPLLILRMRRVCSQPDLIKLTRLQKLKKKQCDSDSLCALLSFFVYCLPATRNTHDRLLNTLLASILGALQLTMSG